MANLALACGAEETSMPIVPPTPEPTPAASLVPEPTSMFTPVPQPAPASVPAPSLAATPSPEPTPTPAPPLPAPTSVPITGVAIPNLAKVADPPGGHISDIVFAPSNPNIVYLASNVNAMGVWRSDDGGDSWRRIYYDDDFGATHVNTVAVHPSNPDVVLISDLHGRITKTSNAGTQWTKVYEEDSAIFALGISTSTPSVAYAGDDAGNVLKSTDGGESWRIVSQVGTTGVGVLALSPRDPNLLFAGTREGIYRSTDGGQSWLRLTPPTSFGFVDTVDLTMASGAPEIVFAATRTGVFRSIDGGVEWSLILNQHAHSVSVSAVDPQILYAGTNTGVYKSGDGGETWQYRSDGIEYLDIGPIAVHPVDSDIAVTGNNIWQWTFHNDLFPSSTSGEGIYKTVDGGVSWSKKTSGFIDVDVVALAVDPSNPNVAYVGMECSRGIFRTEDGGASWVFIGGGPERGSWDIGHYTMRLASAPDSTLYLTGRFGITKSIDRGQSWVPLLVRRHFHGIGVDPNNSQVVFTGTSPRQDPTEDNQYPGARILRSMDGGNTWEEMGLGFPSGADTSIHDFAFDPANSAIVYVTTSSHEIGLPRVSTTAGVHKSTDNGQTWVAINEGLTTREVDSITVSPQNSGRLLAGTEDGVFISVDGGLRWTITGLRESVRSLLVDPSESSNVFSGTEAGLYWSQDGGRTWQRLESVPAQPVTSLAMDAEGRVLYAAVNGVGIFKGVNR